MDVGDPRFFAKRLYQQHPHGEMFHRDFEPGYGTRKHVGIPEDAYPYGDNFWPTDKKEVEKLLDLLQIPKGQPTTILSGLKQAHVSLIGGRKMKMTPEEQTKLQAEMEKAAHDALRLLTKFGV
jgi:hypothetical protein